ncbi:hypothetical protein, partial [Borreliella garinii]|uniref:hypothetical protein n=1 Tax=Borreliella garinii TaxID=29519 RepID=UPI001AEEC397
SILEKIHHPLPTYNPKIALIFYYQNLIIFEFSASKIIKDIQNKSSYRNNIMIMCFTISLLFSL